MTLTVSISDFRRNISDYLARVKAGDNIILKDEKKGEDVAEIVSKKKFDFKRFWETVKRNSPVFTAKNHPEWRTKRDIIKWVEESRKAADRTF